MRWRVRSAFVVATATVIVLVGWSPATAGPPVPGSAKLSENQLQRLERRLLGPTHAEEHRRARAYARRERARWLKRSPAQRRAARRAVARGRQLAQVANPATDGRWTNPFVAPVVGIHSALLPTGKVMLFSQQVNGGRATPGAAVLWDPTKAPGAAGEFKSVPPPNNIWCGAQSLMSDGQLLVTGGTFAHATATQNWRGLRTVYTFNPWTETWTAQPNMPHGRWYPTQTLLPDGRTLITSGFDEVGATNRDIDVFNPPAQRGGVGTISTIARYGSLANAPAEPSWYPHWFVMPGGGVLNAGFTRSESWLLNVTPGAVSAVNRPDWAAQRKYGSAVLLPGGTGGSTRVMQLGGYDHQTTAKAAVATTEIYNDATPTVAPTAGPSLNVRRASLNTVLLPDASIVSIGGGMGEQPGTAAPANANNVQAAAGPEHRAIEIMDPGSNRWRLGPSSTFKKSYHSTALLLPDGRVLAAGDDRDPVRGADYAERDRAEIYEPPYLFKAGERPTITSAPSSLTFDQRFSIGTSVPVTSAVLMAPSATTHANDMSQRMVPLRFTQTAGGADLIAPANRNIAPPGHYMLFVFSPSGKPSVARWVAIGTSPAPNADTQAPAAPAGLAAAPGDGSVTVTWNASTATDTVRYDVYRTAPGARTLVSPASQGTSQTFTDTGLTNGTAQTYVVRAVDAAGNQSADSAPATATPVSSGPRSLYRAINLGGPAVTIDGTAWEPSTAPNYRHNGTAFSAQSVVLNPATDAARASMVRDSVWSRTLAVDLLGVPAGEYEVAVYVWEDNATQTYSLGIEGSVVKANHVSGPRGSWQRLGPYPVTMSDGTLSITTSGGDANISGIEVWRRSATPPPPPPPPPPPTNSPPSVTLTSPASGTTFTAPADVSVAASASDSDGTVARVEFLSGQQVVATDTTSPYETTWSGVAAGSYSLTARAVDDRDATTTSAPVEVTVEPGTGTTPSLYRAINLGGPAVTIDGTAWEPSTAPNYRHNGATFSAQSVVLNPATDGARASMLRDSVWSRTLAVDLLSVPAGDYEVAVYVWEDNATQTYSLSVEGSVVKADHVSGPRGSWQRLGPYPVTVTDGTLSISTSGGDANISGIEVSRRGGV